MTLKRLLFVRDPVVNDVNGVRGNLYSLLAQLTLVYTLRSNETGCCYSKIAVDLGLKLAFRRNI